MDKQGEAAGLGLGRGSGAEHRGVAVPIPSLEAMCRRTVINQSLPLNNIPLKLVDGINQMEHSKLTGRYRVDKVFCHSSECVPDDMWNKYEEHFIKPDIDDITVIKSSKLVPEELRVKHFSVYDDQESFLGLQTARYKFNTYKYEFKENDEQYSHCFSYCDNGLCEDVLITEKLSGEQKLIQTSLNVSKYSNICILKQNLKINSFSVGFDIVLKPTPYEHHRIEDYDTEDEEMLDEGGIGSWQNRMTY